MTKKLLARGRLRGTRAFAGDGIADRVTFRSGHLPIGSFADRVICRSGLGGATGETTDARDLILIKAWAAEGRKVPALSKGDWLMLAGDVMTRDVAFVHPKTPIIAAVEKIVQARISGVPVVDDDGTLVGILTEGDLLRRVELGTAPHHSNFLNFLRGPGLAALEYVKTHTLAVEDVMTRDPVTVGADAALSEVVSCMERSHVRRVPVVDGVKLVGIVSRADLVRSLLQRMKAAAPEDRADEDVRRDIVAEMNRQGWHSLCNVKVAVQDGKVTLTGLAQSEPVFRALRVAAESTPGVKDVDNQVTVLDPMMTALGA
jgi:CBS domain-containing protein